MLLLTCYAMAFFFINAALYASTRCQLRYHNSERDHRALPLARYHAALRYYALRATRVILKASPRATVYARYAIIRHMLPGRPCAAMLTLSTYDATR